MTQKGNNRQRKLGKGRGKQDTLSKGLNIPLNFLNHKQRNSNSQITETPRPKVDSSCISIQNYKGQILTQGGGEGGGERWMGWGRYSHCVLRQGTDSINPGL